MLEDPITAGQIFDLGNDASDAVPYTQWLESPGCYWVSRLFGRLFAKGDKHAPILMSMSRHIGRRGKRNMIRRGIWRWAPIGWDCA